jgi:hypothetical protein
MTKKGEGKPQQRTILFAAHVPPQKSFINGEYVFGEEFVHAECVHGACAK